MISQDFDLTKQRDIKLRYWPQLQAGALEESSHAQDCQNTGWRGLSKDLAKKN